MCKASNTDTFNLGQLCIQETRCLESNPSVSCWGEPLLHRPCCFATTKGREKMWISATRTVKGEDVARFLLLKVGVLPLTFCEEMAFV